MTFKSSATTHVGMVRKVNQDSYAERTDIGVWAVADGMGGHEAGEVASATVTDSIKELQSNEKNRRHGSGSRAKHHGRQPPVNPASGLV